MRPRRRSPLSPDERAEFARWLGDPTAPDPPAALVERTLGAARAELARTPAPVRQRPALPAGFAPELARLLLATAPPVLLLLAWNLALLRTAPALLASVLPEGLATGLVWVHALGSLGWLALAFATVPFAAHRRARMRLPERSP